MELDSSSAKQRLVVRHVTPSAIGHSVDMHNSRSSVWGNNPVEGIGQLDGVDGIRNSLGNCYKLNGEEMIIKSITSTDCVR